MWAGLERSGIGRLLCALSVMLAFADSAAAAEIKVTLLGTGTPTPRLSAFSASTLVEAGGDRLIFDFGRGSSIRLFQKKIPIGSITAHFITHLRFRSCRGPARHVAHGLDRHAYEARARRRC